MPKSLTEQHKKNISNSMKGKMPKNIKWEGFFKGKRHSQKTIMKMRKAKLGKRGKNVNNWKGGKIIKKGYIAIYSPNHPYCSNTYVLEHRLVVENQIGRYLKPIEKVHHLGRKTDNRPQMLMAFINHSAHKRFERSGKIKLKEIIFDGRKSK